MILKSALNLIMHSFVFAHIYKYFFDFYVQIVFWFECTNPFLTYMYRSSFDTYVWILFWLIWTDPLLTHMYESFFDLYEQICYIHSSLWKTVFCLWYILDIIEDIIFVSIRLWVNNRCQLKGLFWWTLSLKWSGCWCPVTKKDTLSYLFLRELSSFWKPFLCARLFSQ